MQATLQHPGPGPPGQLWAPHLMVLVSGQQVNSRVGSPNAPWQKPSHAPTHLTALSISLLPTNRTQTNKFADLVLSLYESLKSSASQMVLL